MKRIIKSKLSISKEKITLRRNYIFSYKNMGKLIEFKNKKKVLFCLSPAYGNLGDQAIAYATKQFIMDNFKEYEFLEFERDEFYSYAKVIKEIIKPEDIIFIQGGGNMGNLYWREELGRQEIVKLIHDCKIISMPTTLSFTEDKSGIKCRNKMKRIYENNKNITLIAREEKTFNMMRSLFDSKSVLTPDIVFYLEDKFEVNRDREGILICLRDDKECYWGNKKEQFITEMKLNHNNIEITDTVVKRRIDKEKREEELFKIWNKFRKAEVVITDRLHGMIFAFITKTPCIVLRSSDHKIIESYKWIKDINYIKFVEELNSNIIEKEINEIINVKTLDRTSFKRDYFIKLAKEIKS